MEKDGLELVSVASKVKRQQNCCSAVKNPPTMQETWVQSLGREDPLEKGNGNPLDWRIPICGFTKELDKIGQLNNNNDKPV